MREIDDKFEVLTYEFISEFIDELYKPYRVYGSVEEIKSIIPKYVYDNEFYNGQVKYIFWNDDKSYAIFNPELKEKEKQKKFRRIESLRTKLLNLRKEQLKHSRKNLTEDEAKLIEDKIDVLINDIFKKRKSIGHKFSSMKEIALFFIFNGHQITRKNSKQIAFDFGYTSKESGEKLYQHFSFYSSRANRRGNEETRRKLINKINLFQKVSEKLTLINKEKIEEEIKLLRNHL